MADFRTNAGDGPLTVQGRRFVGAKTGLIRELNYRLTERSDPDVIVTDGTETAIQYLLDRPDAGPVDLGTGGKGRAIRSSTMRYVGETVERYAAAMSPRYHRYPTVDATYRALTDRDDRVVDIDYLDVFRSDQIEAWDALSEFPLDEEITWARGTALGDGDAVFVPAALISMGDGGAGERYLGPLRTRNGCACAERRVDALLGSLYEFVERDAFMRTWFHQRRPNRIDLEPFPKLCEFRERALENEFRNYHLLDYDTDHDIHVVGCVMEDTRDRQPKFLVAGSANANLRVAIREALIECAQGLQWAHRVAIAGGDAEIPYEEMTDLTLNVAHYLRPENFPDVEFLVRGDHHVPPFEDRDFETTTAELRACVDALTSGGFTPIGFDLTTRDVAEAGLCTTKVHIEEMVPLSAPIHPPKDHPRLCDSRVTDKPHPFP